MFLVLDKTTLGTSNSFTILLNNFALLWAEMPIRLKESLFSLNRRNAELPIEPVAPSNIMFFWFSYFTLTINKLE